MDVASKDAFNSLPNSLISHILSFLSTKEAASTSVLSKRWRLLFALVPSLDFDDSVDMPFREGDQERDETPTSFMEFVDRVLALQENDTINKFSLWSINNVDPDRVTGWLFNVLGRGVSDLALKLKKSEIPLPSEIFVSKTLVRLTLATIDDHGFRIDVKDAYLPKLKILYLGSVVFKEDDGFAKLLSGCPVLEELVIFNIRCTVSSTTLKRLTFYCELTYEHPKNMSFDTPNLVYLEYFDPFAFKYPKLNCGSLVEASLGVEARLTRDWSENVQNPKDYASYFYNGFSNFSEDEASDSREYYSKFSEDDANYSEDDTNYSEDPAEFLMEISNVQILYLSTGDLEVLNFWGERIPVFNNLTQLTVELNTRGLEMSYLVKNCPNLETFIVMGNLPFYYDGREESLWREPYERSIPSWMLSLPVKIIKVYTPRSIEDVVGLELIKQYMERTMPNLEQLIVYPNVSFTCSLMV